MGKCLSCRPKLRSTEGADHTGRDWFLRCLACNPEMACAGELLGLLKEAMDSRAPDYADVAHPGWYGRALAAISRAEAAVGGE